MPANFAPTSLDHVALWVDEREPLATFLCDHLGMHVIDETDAFTLVGIDAKLGKLTLFDAEGPRQRGALERVVLRVNGLDSVLGALPFGAARRGDGVAAFEAPAGLPLGLVESSGRDFDLDHVVLTLEDPGAALACLEEMGFERTPDSAAAVADRHVRVVRGSAAHEIDDVKDAKNTFRGLPTWSRGRPDRVRRAQAGIRARLSGHARRHGGRGRDGWACGRRRGTPAWRPPARAREAGAARWLD